MKQALRNYLVFLWRCARVAFVGDWRYHAWIGALFFLSLLGLNAYCEQLVHGLVTTGMSDEVSWGVYIANFTFLVGVAAAAVMMVIPVYVYRNEELHDLVIFGELLAVAAIIMCLLFVMVDLGRPDNFWHLIPVIGEFNFPASMLSWDVVVLNGYLVLNVYICGYLLYTRYRGGTPSPWFYIPFVFIAIVWAISIHTVTAFLYVGLGGRHFWNSAIVGPRFLASAFTAGPALIILAMQVVRRVTATSHVTESAGNGDEDRGDLPQRRATLEDLEELAAHLPEFAALSREDRKSILPGITVLEAPADHAFLRQGEAETSAFFILDGRVEVEREEGGRHRVTRTVRPGGQFGEVSALSGSPRAGTAVSTAPTRVLRLSAENLRKLMKLGGMNKIIRSRMSERLMITDRALLTLRSIVQVSMIINVFLLLNELFKEFYTGTHHVASSQYLYFGLHGHHALVPWIWTAIAFNLVAMVLLVLPLSRGLRWLNVACVLCILGIWIEKGMGMVVPGFIPTPLGEVMEYQPTIKETMICLGIWAFGLLCYTLLLRMAVPILQGRLTKDDESRAPGETAPATDDPVEAAGAHP